ncbi:dihydrofolate reductase family protein [Pseudonocardia endophytica]|uniref:Riboflavin biosynthesis pyrimidine reductase n=1 Tax=Pseudonocardia endophytica TaxID=401976 RepID=A0A4R1I2G7_PSEEN|nr:dihydrofolate reductase family protein [Pseudonocardia endophytica]TCK27480.1 riboflavin biosynthesis pyrimidine reductase [Pseudonocardia endophytica]
MSANHLVWPPDRAGPIDAAGLEELYRYPDGPVPRVVVNFVSSADGAVTVEGSSRGLSTPPDRQVLDLGTDLADVVLVAAGTAVAEGFTGVKPGERAAGRRARHGLREIAATAVVTASGRSLPADAPVLTDTLVPTIVFTCAAAPSELRDAWAAAGADVVVTGEHDVDLAAVVAELGRRGLNRINCMGGPALFGSMAAAGLVDELRLTVAPFLVSGDAGRIARGTGLDPVRLTLLSVVAAHDTLLVRYAVSPGHEH